MTFAVCVGCQFLSEARSSNLIFKFLTLTKVMVCPKKIGHFCPLKASLKLDHIFMGSEREYFHCSLA